MSTPSELATTYFQSWMAHDFTAFRGILADDVVFDGPMGHVEGGDACTESVKRLAEIITDIVVTKVFVDGPDVLTWYDMHSRDADPMPVANWCHIADGKIIRIRVLFDPRPLLG